jgi:2-succinyl-6-hydroxy-2,4-cyclohexadiene-1-carboxylate synthase
MMRGVPPALVLLHGFTQTRQSWRRTVQALGAPGYRALVPDLPGHGQAAQRTPSFDACTAYVRALAPDRFTLAGYSMGGRIALHAALALQDRLERLVLVGASPGIADASEREARRAADDALAGRIEAIGVEAFAAEWGAQPLFAGQPERVAAAANADRLRNTAAGLAAALRGLGTGAMDPLWERLQELTVPVTLIVGERDEKFRAIAERMRERLRDSRLAVIPGAGHAAQLERPDAVAYQLGSPSSSASA